MRQRKKLVEEISIDLSNPPLWVQDPDEALKLAAGWEQSAVAHREQAARCWAEDSGPALYDYHTTSARYAHGRAEEYLQWALRLEKAI